MNDAEFSPEQYPIQPEHINVKNHFFSAFDNTETEISANWVISFLQKRGQSWNPFSFDEINKFYQKTFKNENFTFNRLIKPEMIPPSLARAFAGHIDPLIPVGGGWIENTGDSYQVTEDFINRCFKSSPKSKLKTSKKK